MKLAELMLSHRELAENWLPKGSGFDAGTRVIECTPNKFVFKADFHHMDENGYYDGWTEHTIRAVSTFNGNEIKVTGKDRNMIKDFISETFNHILFVKEFNLAFNKETKKFSIHPSVRLVNV